MKYWGIKVMSLYRKLMKGDLEYDTSVLHDDVIPD